MTTGSTQDPFGRRHKRSGDCPSSLTLDRHLASELSPSESALLTAHVARCESCAEILDSRKRAYQQFLLAHPRPARRPIPSPEHQPTWFKWLVGAAVGAMAAMLALLLWPRGDHPLPELPERGTRIKGRPFLGFHIRDQGISRSGRSGQTLRPGDNIRFTYHTLTTGHVAVFGVDQAGLVSVYVPFRGERSVAIPAGKEQGLPGSIILDDTLGREWFIGVFCPHDFALARLKTTLASPVYRAASPTIPRSALPSQRCHVSTIWINKVPRR